MSRSELLERLSDLEHQQWMEWAKTLMESEPSISEERKERWKKNFVPYGDLSEEAKDQDRVWARKTLELLQEKPMNKYLEKIASSDHILAGIASPAWQEHLIAKDHGRSGSNRTHMELLEKHIGGSGRADLRSGLEAAIGSTMGRGASSLVELASKGKIPASRLRLPLAGVGFLAGASHGLYRSLKNQAAEAHEKYSK